MLSAHYISVTKTLHLHHRAAHCKAWPSALQLCDWCTVNVFHSFALPETSFQVFSLSHLISRHNCGKAQGWWVGTSWAATLHPGSGRQHSVRLGPSLRAAAVSSPGVFCEETLNAMVCYHLLFNYISFQCPEWYFTHSGKAPTCKRIFYCDDYIRHVSTARYNSTLFTCVTLKCSHWNFTVLFTLLHLHKYTHVVQVDFWIVKCFSSIRRHFLNQINTKCLTVWMCLLFYLVF